MKGVTLEPFQRVVGEYGRIAGLSIPVNECSNLAAHCQNYGVDGYCLHSFEGNGYFNRLMNYQVHQVPTFIYRRHTYVPLLFRANEASHRLFLEEKRLQSFFILLDWYLENKPQEIILNYTGTLPIKRTAQGFARKQAVKQIVDSAFLNFRLTEILDAAGLPLSQLSSLADFISWNKGYRLIDNGNVGRHSMNFDVHNPVNVSELAMIMKIIQMKYPQAATIFSPLVAG